MVQLIIAAVVVAAAVGLGLVLRRRQRVDSPTQVSHHVPTQLDRRDFPEPGAPWLVAVFSSATCATCADVVRKALVMRSSEVAVCEIEYTADRDLHDRYSIAAVPIVVVADSDGVVQAAFTGPVSATDLWAAVAEARQPGNSPEPGLGTLE
jgi:hypothetical protein